VFRFTESFQCSDASLLGLGIVVAFRENDYLELCGNKIDREDLSVDQAEAEKWANNRRFTIVFTSALTGENVDMLVDHVARRFLGPMRIEPIRPHPAARGPKEGPRC
jgi:hypothetical protein